MSKPLYTPGPWQVFKRRELTQLEILIDNGGEAYLAQVFLAPDGTNQDIPAALANARLIAAAPELLEACREFLLCGPNAGHNQDLVEQVKQAINKAEGSTK